MEKSFKENSALDIGEGTLADMFGKYFINFVKACDSAVSFFDEFDIYQPVRLVIVDVPGFAHDKNKLLTEYDALEGMPFWLR
ncbi:hypothetical protein [Pandoraea sputorum]